MSLDPIRITDQEETGSNPSRYRQGLRLRGSPTKKPYRSISKASNFCLMLNKNPRSSRKRDFVTLTKENLSTESTGQKKALPE